MSDQLERPICGRLSYAVIHTQLETSRFAVRTSPQNTRSPRNARIVCHISQKAHISSQEPFGTLDAYRRTPKVDEINEILPREFLEGITANYRMDAHVTFYYPTWKNDRT